MALKIASFNVNSINARIGQVSEWLNNAQPDIACFQELKTIDENFPALDIKALGYDYYAFGQKSYNGVAILYKRDLAVTLNNKNIPNFDDTQSRLLSVNIGNLMIINIYAPNGNPYPSEKFDYKCAWYEALIDYVKTDLLPQQKPFVICGDYNICPRDEDCYDSKQCQNDAVMQPQSRAYYRQLCNLGLWDAWRHCHPNASYQYSYWDYQGGAYAKNHGLLIDHFLLSPLAMDMLESCDITPEVRGMEKPSDHTPVICCLNYTP